MKPPSKTMCIILIAVILAFTVIQIVSPEKEAAPGNYNLTVVIGDTDVTIGSIQVSYARWDGTQVAKTVRNEEQTPIVRGSELQFGVLEWPATVLVCADLEGGELLASAVIEEAPPENCRWRAMISEEKEGLRFTLTDDPMEGTE